MEWKKLDRAPLTPAEIALLESCDDKMELMRMIQDGAAVRVEQIKESIRSAYKVLGIPAQSNVRVTENGEAMVAFDPEPATAADLGGFKEPPK